MAGAGEGRGGSAEGIQADKRGASGEVEVEVGNSRMSVLR